MSGKKDLNFPLFHREAARLRAEGWHVVNPAEINPDPGAGWLPCMRADIKQLVDCDSILMLQVDDPHLQPGLDALPRLHVRGGGA